MTGQEKVILCLKILNKYQECNSSWNLEILKELSDEELLDENKILEKIYIIRMHRERSENPGRYSEEIMEFVRQRLGLKYYDTSRDEEIGKMTPDTIFEHVCSWNNMRGYDHLIKEWVCNIYNVDLRNVKDDR